MRNIPLNTDEHTILMLFSKLGLVSVVSEVREIDHHPNYDLTPYKGNDLANYVFESGIKFPESISTVFDVELEEPSIYHVDALNKSAKEYGLSNLPEWAFGEKILNSVLAKSGDVDEVESWEPSIDQFKLKSFTVKDIDQSKKVVAISGAYLGESAGIEPVDWSLYSLVKFYGFRSPLEDQLFYQELLGQAFMAFRKANYRLCVFLAYSAMDAYISEANDQKDRFTEKLRDAFVKKFGKIDRHEIYTSLIGVFKDELVPARNDIAHGRPLRPGKDSSSRMLAVCVALITSLEKGLESFNELKSGV